MFYGEFPHSMDSKGRITIPSRLRSPLKDYCVDQFVVTRGFELCLYMFAPSEWHQIEKKFRSLTIFKSKTRALQRSFFSGASIVDCDAQGRILIPKTLLDYAKIMKDVLIVGVSTRIELWAPEHYQEQMQDRDAYAKTAEELMTDFEIQ